MERRMTTELIKVTIVVVALVLAYYMGKDQERFEREMRLFKDKQ